MKDSPALTPFVPQGARTGPAIAVASVIWLFAVAAGFAALWRYKSTPGGEGTASLSWPAGTRIHLSRDRATLVMFAHPKCSCTRASIAELAQVMARLHDRVEAYAVFAIPGGAGEDWAHTDLWSSAARIPGVTALRDEGGSEAARFGIATSGAVVLYAPSGTLLFKGGITSARGHEGNSFGQERIVSLLTRGTADRADAPTFGCALQEKLPAARAAGTGTTIKGDET